LTATGTPVAVKGGGGLRFRYGLAARASRDLDLAIPNDQLADDFRALLDESFGRGWSDFTATIGPADDYRPPDFPDEYVVRRYKASLRYRREVQSWTTITVEVSRDEVGGVNAARPLLDNGFVTLFRALGVEDPSPVAVFPIDFQVAQKLHACTDLTRPNERAHDLVDIQMLLADVPRAERRERLLQAVLDTFRYRETAWPATVVQQPRWDTLYEAATHEVIGVLPDVRSAISWANELIGDIGT